MCILKGEILKLWNEGLSIAEISEILHCGRSTVKYHLVKENLYDTVEVRKRGINFMRKKLKGRKGNKGNKSPWNSKHISKEEIIKLWNEGKSTHEIAKILGCTTGNVIFHLKKAGLYNSEEVRKRWLKFLSDYFKEIRPSTRPDVRKKISEKMRGRKLTEEHKKKISESVKRWFSIPQNKLKFLLRNNANHYVSSLEDKLYQKLVKYFPKIRIIRQYPIVVKSDNETFIQTVYVDLALPDYRLAIFADGCYWHSCPICFGRETIKGKRGYDAMITNYLKRHGWKVLRFWEHELKSNLDNCIEKIRREVCKYGMA